MDQDYQYTVCTWCLTFNHAPYIMDTLRGFCMQETNFPVINVIIDDCSTDGEEDVIDSFVANELDINDNSTARHDENDEFIVTFARHKTNQNCFFVIYYYKENHYSIKKARPSVIDEWKEKAKYVALCEGDDYWIDPLKLQKQVDFLEKNEDYGLVHTNFYTNTDGKITKSYKKTRTRNYEEILLSTEISTLTVLIRSSIYMDYLTEIKPQERGWFVIGDAPIWKYAAYRSKVILLEDITSMYRFHASSISHSGNFENKAKIVKTAHDIKCYYNKYYSPKERFEYLQKLIDKSYFQSYMEVCAYFRKTKKAVAFLSEYKKEISKKNILFLFVFYIIERLKVFYHHKFA